MGGSFFSKESILHEIRTDIESEIVDVINQATSIGYKEFNIHHDLECEGIYFYLVASNGNYPFPVKLLCNFRCNHYGAEVSQNEDCDKKESVGVVVITNDELAVAKSFVDKKKEKQAAMDGELKSQQEIRDIKNYYD